MWNTADLRYLSMMWNLADLRYLSKKWMCCCVLLLGKDFNTKTTSHSLEKWYIDDAGEHKNGAPCTTFSQT